ncbi:MAG: phage head protein [Betaproteobacteria bacterium]|nr:phage head protein [Betaproteobacteria bacterium]
MPDSPHASARDPAIAAVFKRPFDEQLAFFRQKLGNLVPTERWTDLWKNEHDRGFMVAGAAKADLLSDLAAAVERTLAEGKSLEAFRQDFGAIVERHGWSYRGGFDWRSRVIYQTNAATSYAAGRLAQLRAGGFDVFVYRHSDSVRHPRPLHLAWNGLTLPADHEFWRTHYPPNGWGCRCYVLGARDAKGARRLGGEPDKRIDPAWQQTNPKTGEPVGIDRGWGYLPGETVADTVQAMAEKTRQWQYEIGKAYMQGVPEAVRDGLATAYRALPSVADDTRRYAARILEGREEIDIPPYRTLGLLTVEDARRVAELKGLDVSGHDYALDPSAIRHIHKEHGDPAIEAPRGQRAVTAADYARLPELLNSPDAIEDAGLSWFAKRPLLRVRKRFGEEEWVLALEVRAGRKMLVPDSLYILERRSP